MARKKGKVTSIELSGIRMDGGTQPRASIDFTTVDDYADLMKEGVRFPPVVVFYDGTDYWLADGFHRCKAASAAGFSEIACELIQGTQEDAQWYSFGANKTNGMRRTNQDKVRALDAALGHPRAAGLSDGTIADHCGVSSQMVKNHRPPPPPAAPLARSAAPHFNPFEVGSSALPRTGRDGRTINTANIGRGSMRVTASAAIAQPEERPNCDRKVAGSIPAGGPNVPERRIELPTPISQKRLWAAQETKHFTKELLRLLKFYEKAHDRVSAITIVRSAAGVPVGIEVSFAQKGIA